MVEDLEHPPERPLLPNPPPIEAQPFKWTVITPERPPEPGVPYIALTVPAYEVLPRNMAEVTRWIEEATWRLQSYRGELDGRE